MPTLSIGQTSNCVNPEIDIYFQKASVPIDVEVLEFIIYEKVTNPPNLVQTYPVTGRAAVNTADTCPTGHKISTGHYVAEWTVPPSEPIGMHEIHWFYKETIIHSEQSFVEEFTVEAAAVPFAFTGIGYCTVQSIRDEGFNDPPYTDERIESMITLASLTIDRATGWWFESKSLTFPLDGTGGPTLYLEFPIIDITSVTMNGDEIDLNDLIVYNRHVSNNLLLPDDRRNPRIEWNMNYEHIAGDRFITFNSYRWIPGRQNIEITGLFGYTDYDGTATGKTPDMIVHLCKLLTIRELQYMSDPDARDDWRERHRVNKHKTRDQEIGLTAQKTSPIDALTNNMLTGDPEIDMWIKYYRKSPKMHIV